MDEEIRMITELIELRWRVARLEEMKNGRWGWEKKLLNTEEENLHQNLSFQFFLRMKSSHVMTKADGFAGENDHDQ